MLVVFPERMQLMTEKTACPPSESSLGASGRDRTLLDAPQSDLIWWGFSSLMENTQRCTCGRALQLTFMWNQKESSLAVKVQTCSSKTVRTGGAWVALSVNGLPLARVMVPESWD